MSSPMPERSLAIGAESGGGDRAFVGRNPVEQFGSGRVPDFDRSVRVAGDHELSAGIHRRGGHCGGICHLKLSYEFSGVRDPHGCGAVDWPKKK